MEISLTKDTLAEGVEEFNVEITEVSFGEIGDIGSTTVLIADHPGREGFVAVDKAFQQRRIPSPPLVDQAPSGRIWTSKGNELRIFTNNGKLERRVRLDFSPGAIKALGKGEALVGDSNQIVRVDAERRTSARFGRSIRTLRGFLIDDHGRVYAYGESLVRFHGNGMIDSTFQPVEPTLKANSDDQPAIIKTIELQHDGRILLAGDFNAVTRVVRQGIARVNNNGSLDSSFRSAVRVNPSWSFNILAGAENKLILNSANDQVAVRLYSDGRLDRTLDTSLWSGGSLHVLSDGRLLMAGAVYRDTERKDFALINSDGSEVPFFWNPLQGERSANFRFAGESGDSALFVAGGDFLQRLLLPNSLGAQYEYWRRTSVFRELAAKDDPSTFRSSDADGDGRSNVLEFVAGSDPQDPLEHPTVGATINPLGELRISIEPFLGDMPSLSWLQLQHSDDLKFWEKAGVMDTQVDRVQNRVTWSINQRFSGKGFWRLLIND